MQIQKLFQTNNLWMPSSCCSRNGEGDSESTRSCIAVAMQSGIRCSECRCCHFFLFLVDSNNKLVVFKHRQWNHIITMSCHQLNTFVHVYSSFYLFCYVFVHQHLRRLSNNWNLKVLTIEDSQENDPCNGDSSFNKWNMLAYNRSLLWRCCVTDFTFVSVAMKPLSAMMVLFQTARFEDVWSYNRQVHLYDLYAEASNSIVKEFFNNKIVRKPKNKWGTCKVLLWYLMVLTSLWVWPHCKLFLLKHQISALQVMHSIVNCAVWPGVVTLGLTIKEGGGSEHQVMAILKHWVILLSFSCNLYHHLLGCVFLFVWCTNPRTCWRCNSKWLFDGETSENNQQMLDCLLLFVATMARRYQKGRLLCAEISFEEVPVFGSVPM